MSVYTTVEAEELAVWARQFAFSGKVKLTPIAAGITNSNYFLTTNSRRYVLTLFEALRLEELDFYLELMSHLASNGVACPAPVAANNGSLSSVLAGKPACVVTCINGEEIKKPVAKQCFAVGAMLAKMHQASQNFAGKMPNPRGWDWWNKTSALLYSELPDDDAALLREEVAFQYANRNLSLPQGVIHADLFKDNVLMDGDKVGGFIDLYYACNDALLYDVAVALNDWAVQSNGDLEQNLAQAMLAGYQSVRTFIPAEIKALPIMLRAAALRFWLSRMFDFYKPQSGILTYTKDPQVFKRIVLQHQVRKDFWLN